MNVALHPVIGLHRPVISALPPMPFPSSRVPALGRPGGRLGQIINTCLILAVCALLCGCASDPIASLARPVELFQDQTFLPATTPPVSAKDIFALNPAMQSYLEREIAAEVKVKGRAQGLLDGLYQKQKLLLEYDAAMTRTASEAFDARAGNCLSLVIMTSAFAKAMNLPVRYQSVTIGDHWTRNSDMLLLAGHVNLTLGVLAPTGSNLPGEPHELTVDFIPPDLMPALRTRVIDESLVVAMFYNNRAAESIATGRLDDAYWLARAAIMHDPRYHAAYITLGSIYRRHGDLASAERVLRHVLQSEPENLLALGNLAITLQAGGRGAEAEALNARLAKLQPYPPYAFFDQGIQAMAAGNYQSARDLFQREINRDAYVAEFYFWLSAACYQLGDVAAAQRHMQSAMECSTTDQDRGLYAGKLDLIKASRSNRVR